MIIDTQLQAYAAIKESRVAILTTKVKRALREHGALTTEEICDKAREDYKSIQPRTSELHEALEIYDTKLRRHNESGKKAIVWAMVETEAERQLAVRQTLKKEKPVGDPKLWGKLRQSQYALAAKKDEFNHDEVLYRLLVLYARFFLQ